MLAPAASAQADSYCVGATGCDHDVPAGLQAALDTAAAHNGPDEVKIGNLTIGTTTGFTYDSAAPVHITGAGGRTFGGQGGTSLVDTSGATNPSGHTVLSVLGSTGSTISGLNAAIPSGTGNLNTGIETTGTVENVAVEAPNGALAPTGVKLDTDGALVNSEVLLPLANSTGVASSGQRTAVRDSALQAAVGVTTLSAGASLAVESTEIEFSKSAADAISSDVTIRDSLLVNRSESVVPREGLATVSGGGQDAAITADHVTLIGTTDPNSVAMFASSTGSAASTITFRGGIVTGYPSVFRRDASGAGAASIATAYSDYTGAVAQSNGPGAITESNQLTAAPGFSDQNNYTLSSGSPLVDAGDPAEPGGLDGDGDCTARRDIGAFEFMPGPRAPRAVATVAGDSFDASGSCDPDGDALSFAWAFDDGATASTATVQHTFTRPGTHSATVTVTDSTGRATTATALVTVPAPPPPPFAGVTIRKQTVKVSKKGVAKVKLACPAATAGACAGTLKLLRKAAAFRIAPGKTARVTVKLSKAKLKALRRKRTLKATATAVAHDANGSAKTTSGKLTLRSPR